MNIARQLCQDALAADGTALLHGTYNQPI